MKQHKRFVRVTALTICFILIAAMMPRIRMDANDKEQIVDLPVLEINTDATHEGTDGDQTDMIYCSMKPLYLRPILNNTDRFTHGSMIQQSYEIVGCDDADEIQIRLQPDEGIELISGNTITVKQEENHQITVQYRLKEEYDNGEILINIEAYENEGVVENGLSTGIYCVNAGAYDYMSLNNMEDAMYLAGLVRYDTDLPDVITSIPFANPGTGISTMSTATTAISGTIRWTDSTGTTHAARNMTVEIYYNYNGTWHLAGTATTNASGQYSASLSTGSGYSVNVCIEVLSTGSNINVKVAGGGLYETQSAITSIITGTTTDISYTFGNNTNAGKAVSVHQAMVHANVAVSYMEGNLLAPIDVYFPDSSKGTSCFSTTTSSKSIHILQVDGWDWDVLQHEFGHYVQHTYGIKGNVGGDHRSDWNLADYYENKSYGIQLAWTEGWATYFAMALQDALGLSALGIPYVGDAAYTDKEDDGPDYSIEMLESKRLLGEANEACVAAILYDLTDGISASDNDNVSISCITLWNTTTDNACITLSALITAVNNSTNYSNMQKLYIGDILSGHMVSAKITDIDNITSSSATVAWEQNSGSTDYKNNSFRLAVYDANYNLILKTNSTTGTSITLSSTEVSAIINATGNTVYGVVETQQTHTPQTGPYNSNVYVLD